MARNSQPGEKGRPAAAAASKDEIDRGLTLDKVPGFDPGAAPLGTDAESAGTPALGPVRARTDAAPPSKSAGLAADPSGTGRSSYRMQDRLVWPAIAVLLLIAAVIAFLLFAG